VARAIQALQYLKPVQLELLRQKGGGEKPRVARAPVVRTHARQGAVRLKTGGLYVDGDGGISPSRIAASRKYVPSTSRFRLSTDRSPWATLVLRAPPSVARTRLRRYGLSSCWIGGGVAAGGCITTTVFAVHTRTKSGEKAFFLYTCTQVVTRIGAYGILIFFLKSVGHRRWQTGVTIYKTKHPCQR
jgi:hypothetical protein